MTYAVGDDPDGIFPTIADMKVQAWWSNRSRRDVGEEGRSRHSLFTPEGRMPAAFAQTNLCTESAPPGPGLMRRHLALLADGKKLHTICCSTSPISPFCRKARSPRCRGRAVRKVFYICCRHTGAAPFQHRQVEIVARRLFGLGGIGLMSFSEARLRRHISSSISHLTQGVASVSDYAFRPPEGDRKDPCPIRRHTKTPPTRSRRRYTSRPGNITVMRRRWKRATRLGVRSIIGRPSARNCDAPFQLCPCRGEGFLRGSRGRTDFPKIVDGT